MNYLRKTYKNLTVNYFKNSSKFLIIEHHSHHKDKFSPFEWFIQNKKLLVDLLSTNGALIFRNFFASSSTKGNQQLIYDFNNLIKSINLTEIQYTGGGSPGRKKVYEHAFTSTAYPANARLFIHNELTYTLTPPKYIFFFCVQPSAIGGETAIADSREIYSKIDPTITKQLEDRNVKYSRMFIDEKRLAEIDPQNHQLAKTWQLAFNVQNSKEAEHLARQVGYEDIRWYPNGDMYIRTKSLPATRPNEKIWFNQVQGWDPRIAVDVKAINENLHLTIHHPYEELFQYYPQGCYYGNTDEIISYDELKHINDITWSCAHNLDWKQGDLLWIDNFQTAHGKRPHVDNDQQQRQILASLADP